MKSFLRSLWGKITLITLAVAVLAAVGFGIFWYVQPKFAGVTIELGDSAPELSAFLMDNAVEKWASFVTAPESLDLSAVGTQKVELTHLGRKETVEVEIVDTVAPIAEFRNIAVTVDDVITADMFVVSSEDLSPVTISFVTEPGERNGYDDQTVVVAVTDVSGNTVTGECTISYTWMKESITVELGTKIVIGDLLLNYKKGAHLLDKSFLAELNTYPAGEYEFVSTDGGKTCICKVYIVDTIAPELEGKSLTVEQGAVLTMDDFLVSVSDISKDVKVTLDGDISATEPGTFPLVLKAEDPSGNVTAVELTLTVAYDLTPPYFMGVGDMNVEKNSQPDYVAGVSAYDARDGALTFTVDSSRVNLTKAGTYYVVYSAIDKTGNAATYRRRVVVAHDAEDTNALVAQHAALCGTSIESIRNYVRNSISYSTDWGGSDPVWYGFTNRVGNCYVHALCLQRLLAAHGYESQLIWVVDHSHYWLIVNMGGSWKHIDATPSYLHGMYMFMNDAQRLETLSGRVWDTTLWPACE